MVVILLSDFMSPGDVSCDNRFCRKGQPCWPRPSRGCLQDVQFPDASLSENSDVASIASRHTSFVQCLAQNSKSSQNLNVLESALHM